MDIEKTYIAMKKREHLGCVGIGVGRDQKIGMCNFVIMPMFIIL